MNIRKHQIYPVLLVLIWLMSGCVAVYTTEPVGDEPVKLQAQDWEGTWVQDKDFFVIRLSEPDQGMLVAAWIEEENDSLKLESLNGHIRATGDTMFISFRDKDYPDSPRYFWARIKQDGRQIIFWQPEEKAFKALVESKQLPGSIDDDNIILEPLKNEHLRFIIEDKNKNLFDWQEPIVFLKLGE